MILKLVRKLFPKTTNNSASTDFSIVENPDVLKPEELAGWQDPSVARRQLEAFSQILKNMYAGNVRRDFEVAGKALELIGINNPSILEVGCGNGYYSEVFSYLFSGHPEYTGVDFSEAMIGTARLSYPKIDFRIGDACDLPFDNQSFDVVWSGTVLMHVANYPKAIEEARRVSRQFVVFHTTPLTNIGKTTFIQKKAYGSDVIEVLIDKEEFEALLSKNQLKVIKVFESITYNVPLESIGLLKTLSYVCERV